MIPKDENTSYRILVIDDNTAIHQDFRKILGKSAAPVASIEEMEFNLFGSQYQARTPIFEIDCATQGEDGLEKVKQAKSMGKPYSLVFVDGRMPPGWDGVETINHLWQESPEIQVVLCTAYTDYSWQEIQHTLGKSDGMLILKKPFDNIEVLQLAHTLSRKWELNQEIENRLNRLAYFDELTGLPNRTLFFDRFTQTLKNAARYGDYAALLFLDLDNFKRINDTLGHMMGDELLKIAAERISRCLRGSDTFARSSSGEIAARMGGDEFTVVLSKIDEPVEAALVANRIAEQFNQPIQLGSYRVNVSACIGISIYPQDGETVEALLKNADIAMYQAKRQGPAMFYFYKETMNANALRQFAIENHLRQALQRGEFSLHYQPQVNLMDGQVVGMEALLRWQNCELQSVPPAEFIPLAEQNGLIIPIGEWALTQACRQAKAWLDQGLPLPRMAVNVSIKQITHTNFLEMVAQALSESGLDPHRLEIEITESLFMEYNQKTTSILQKLEEMDVQIAIDDFGLDFSSLGRLRDFRVNHLKIDDCFLNAIETDTKNQSIIGAIIAMAENMHMNVVAEGVETATQAEFLRGKQCPEAQGYLFSYPLPALEAQAFLEQARLSAPVSQDGCPNNLDTSR